MRATLLLLPALLAACAAVRPAERPVTLRLTVSPAPPSASPSAPRVAGVIAIAPVGARGLAGSLRYTYVDASAPAELRQAATLFWEEPPPRVLERALIAGLRTRFAGVLGPGVPGMPERRVVAELDRMEEVSAGGAARAIVAFGVTLSGSGSGKAATGADYCASVPIAGSAPSARADAFGAAMGLAVARFAGEAAAGGLIGMPC